MSAPLPSSNSLSVMGFTTNPAQLFQDLVKAGRLSRFTFAPMLKVPLLRMRPKPPRAPYV